MTKQFKQNLLNAYNEALDNKRMKELTARESIQKKYNVLFIKFDNKTKRYTDVRDMPAEYKPTMTQKEKFEYNYTFTINHKKMGGGEYKYIQHDKPEVYENGYYARNGKSLLTEIGWFKHLLFKNDKLRNRLCGVEKITNSSVHVFIIRGGSVHREILKFGQHIKFAS